MKSAPKRRPIDHVNPDLNPERVQRMWGAVAAAQGRPARRAVRWSLAAAAVVLLGGLGAYHATREPDARAARQGERIVTEERATDLTLPDGSALALSRASALSVLAADPRRGDARLRVERGRVRFDVPHREGRSFVVEVRDVRVVVLGTRFAVSVEEHTAHTEIQVGVERGRVEVQDRAGHVLSTLGPNQSWLMEITPAPAAATSAAAPAASAPEPAPAPAVAAPSARAASALQAAPASSAAAASTLLEQANLARIEGRTAQAATDYQRVYQRYPRDPRAGLAAFELARIRLHSLHDARGALVALRFALGHNQGGYLAEDAAALRIDALQRTGDLAACREARDEFLQHHAESAHLKRVRDACAE